MTRRQFALFVSLVGCVPSSPPDSSPRDPAVPGASATTGGCSDATESPAGKLADLSGYSGSIDVFVRMKGSVATPAAAQQEQRCAIAETVRLGGQYFESYVFGNAFHAA